MPKYYVWDGYEKATVEAPSEVEAAVKCVLYFFNSFVVNGLYKVSQKGFRDHTDDIIINSNDILDIISRNKKKGGDNT